MKAIVKVPVCSLLAAPTRESTLEDEVLYGMVVEILEAPAPGWYRIRTHYRYEGIVSGEDLLVDDEAAARWEALPKKVIRNKNFCDVLSEPKVQGWILAALPRGGVVSPVGQPEKGWRKILLVDGRTGFLPESILSDLPTAPVSQDESVLRQALVDSAMLYRGTHYRWGGKSPMGIDCSGLCSMAYLLCGILIYRDAHIREDFPIHEIPIEAIKPGDLLFFPGHVAMYIGSGRYCHSTGKHGDNGFTVNSLIPSDPDYRADLREHITQVGSYF
ncbi:MAG: SH3 domain-containing C40 family peptidase [Firmicutes bacterium]|nr:SH3 domain-containing C40 family peptidase [Bacillota bacterium]